MAVPFSFEHNQTAICHKKEFWCQPGCGLLLARRSFICFFRCCKVNKTRSKSLQMLLLLFWDNWPETSVKLTSSTNLAEERGAAVGGAQVLSLAQILVMTRKPHRVRALFGEANMLTYKQANILRTTSTLIHLSCHGASLNLPVLPFMAVLCKFSAGTDITRETAVRGAVQCALWRMRLSPAEVVGTSDDSAKSRRASAHKYDALAFIHRGTFLRHERQTTLKNKEQRHVLGKYRSKS